MTDATYAAIPDADVPESAITPLDEAHPNPYEGADFDGKQDVVTQDEGLGGTFASTTQARLNWRAAHESGTETLPDGQPIHEHCLSGVRQYRDIGALYYSAQQQSDESKQRHDVTYETVDWSKVPPGAPLTFRVGQYGHIAHFLGVTKVGPLCWTTDVPTNKVSLVNPIYFRLHWGAELEAYLGDLEGVDLGLTDPGQHQDPPHNPPHNQPVNWVLPKAERAVLLNARKILGQLAQDHPNIKTFQDAASALTPIVQHLGDFLG